VIADGFDVAVLALAIVVIRVLTERQEAKSDAEAVRAPEPRADREPAAGLRFAARCGSGGLAPPDPALVSTGPWTTPPTT